MPRRKLVAPTKAVTFRIDEKLASQYELLLLDPIANRSSYGKKSLIVEQLIGRFIACAKQGTSTIDVSDLLHHMLQE